VTFDLFLVVIKDH